MSVIESLATAARSLRRNPGFSACVIACVAVGIGAATATFCVLDATFLRAPSGVGDPGGLARVYVAHGSQRNVHLLNKTSYPDYRRLAAADLFANIAAYANHDVD